MATKDIIIRGNKSRAKDFLSKVQGKKPLFITVIGNTESGKIPGISAAGANPDITDFTPAADMEYLTYGKCKVIDGVPVTPDGIPTPAIISKACLELTDFPFIVAVGGLNVYPDTPYIEFGGSPGRNIESGDAVSSVETAFENAKIFGENISKTIDYLVIGESIAGGTTTALGVLTAMGYEASDKVSSSLPSNPLNLKNKVVLSGLKSRGIKPGDYNKQPLEAIKAVGDPIQPVVAGITIGAGLNIPILLAGGTQMAAIIGMINATDPSVLNNVAIGTTKWIIEDSQTDLEGIISQINTNVPILAANLDFSEMRYDGLKIYEKGVVKEGVGAGGLTISTLLYNKSIDLKMIQDKIEEDYSKLI